MRECENVVVVIVMIRTIVLVVVEFKRWQITNVHDSLYKMQYYIKIPASAW